MLMAAGSVLTATGKSNMRDLGGLWGAMPVTAVCAIIGFMRMNDPGTKAIGGEPLD